MPPYTEIDITSPDNGVFGPTLSASPFDRGFGPFIDPTPGLLGFSNYIQTDDHTHWVAYQQQVTIPHDGAVLGIGTWNGTGSYDQMTTISVAVLDPTGTTWTFYDIEVSHYGQTFFDDQIPIKLVTDGIDVWIGLLMPHFTSGSQDRIDLHIYHFNGTTWDLIDTRLGTNIYSGQLSGCASANDSGVAHFGWVEGNATVYTKTIFVKVDTTTEVWNSDPGFVASSSEFPMANDIGTCIFIYPSSSTVLKQYSLDPATGSATHLQDITVTTGTYNPKIGNLNPDGSTYFLAIGIFGTGSIKKLYKIAADGSSAILIISSMDNYSFVYTTDDGSGNIKDIWLNNLFGSWYRYDNSCYHDFHTTVIASPPSPLTGFSVQSISRPYVVSNHIYTFGFDGSFSTIKPYCVIRYKLKYLTCPFDTHSFKRCLGYFKDGVWNLAPASGPQISYFKDGEWKIAGDSPSSTENSLVVFKDDQWKQSLELD